MTPARAIAPVDITPQDLALLQYTGGTTGRPKGAMLGHDQLSVNAQQVAAINPFGNASDEVFMGALPFFHVFANTALLNHAVRHRCLDRDGCRGSRPSRCWRPSRNTAAPAFPACRTMFQAMLDHPDLANTDLSSLKVCISGRCADARPGSRPLRRRRQRCGWSKATASPKARAWSRSILMKARAGAATIGQLVPGTEVILLDKEHPENLAPEGEPGELAVCGPQVMRGYWNPPRPTPTPSSNVTASVTCAPAMSRGSTRTGSSKLSTASKDMIAVGGFKVFPSAVEDVLPRTSGGQGALVIGVPEKYRGEVPRAYVTSAKRCGPSRPRPARLAQREDPKKKAKHERVDEVVIRSELPRTIIGKLDRKALRAEVL